MNVTTRTTAATSRTVLGMPAVLSRVKPERFAGAVLVDSPPVIC
jgi:hypothetical protein